MRADGQADVMLVATAAYKCDMPISHVASIRNFWRLRTGGPVGFGGKTSLASAILKIHSHRMRGAPHVTPVQCSADDNPQRILCKCVKCCVVQSLTVPHGTATQRTASSVKEPDATIINSKIQLDWEALYAFLGSIKDYLTISTTHKNNINSYHDINDTHLLSPM